MFYTLRSVLTSYNRAKILIELTNKIHQNILTKIIENMKKVFVIIIVIFLHINLFAGYGGGGSSYYHLKLDLFEQSFNFYYKAIDDTVFYKNTKGKERFIKATVNIAFYDIKKDTSFLLFEKDFNHKIKAFFYEKEYNAEKRKIDFVAIDDTYGSDYIANNSNIERREISDNIYIITYSVKEKKHYLWSCHKTGKNLKLITEFDSFYDFKMDIYNDIILVTQNISRDGLIIKRIEK